MLRRYTEDAEVYELFLKGRYHSYKYTAQGWKRAIEFFEKAIDRQPDYALAYAGIAAARGCQWFFGILPAEQTIPQSKSANSQALAHRRRPGGRVSVAGDDHLLLRLGLAASGASSSRSPSPSIRTTPRRCPTTRCFSPLPDALDEAIRLNRKSAHPGSARAAHQHEWRMDLLCGRDAGRGVTAGREDDRE